MSQIKHKEALYEIFEAKMGTGEALDGKCDVILKTNISKLPDNVRKFICLSDFVTTPAPTGRLQDKYMVALQDIICGGVVRERSREGDVDAEFWSYELARIVRTILRENQILSSATYPSGVARRHYIQETPQEFVLYYDTQCCIHTVRLDIHLQEVD